MKLINIRNDKFYNFAIFYTTSSQPKGTGKTMSLSNKPSNKKQIQLDKSGELLMERLAKYMINDTQNTYFQDRVSMNSICNYHSDEATVKLHHHCQPISYCCCKHAPA